MVELLVPSGDLEKVNIAYLYGANATYIGGTLFSLRQRASNFSIDDIFKACEIAHNNNKKLYVTVNIYPLNDASEDIINYLRDLQEANVDAIIVSSPGIIEAARKFTSLEVHLSTQASVTNSYILEFYQKLGVKRVVLARELTFSDIVSIKNNTSLDLEVFIHGGMCMSYSGRCSLSNNMCARDANLGFCAHACRWDYKLHEGDNKLCSSTFSLSSKDLNALRTITKLIDIGISSFKIEGRMKSLHYIATVTKVYRQLIDEYTKFGFIKNYNTYEKELLKAENRQTWGGYFFTKTTSNSIIYDLNSEEPNQIFLGIVKSYDKTTKTCIIEQRNYFTITSKLELMTPNALYKNIGIKKIYDLTTNEKLDTARHPKQMLKVIFSTKKELELVPNSFVRLYVN
ncbi:MAG: U32 family peptidase [Acholeplasmatales bacterium]|jgi:putative protease|nr:U32 family peptidase [Acholeplasmatales bacterium]